VNDHIMVVLGPCVVCDGVFAYDPDRVPSILIDPDTGQPPDVAPDGGWVPASPEASARSRREPYCPECARRLNAEARRRGMPAHFDETSTIGS
jgi:hypothetical protein